MPRGSIHLVLGPMASGKSLQLLSLADAEQTHTPPVAGEVMYIGSRMNTRDGGFITSRAFGGGMVGVKLTASVDRLADVVHHSAFEAARILCVDELHMFLGAAEDLKMLAFTYRRTVIAAGLYADKLNVPFTEIATCIARATSTVHMQARCVVCSRRCACTRARIKGGGDTDRFVTSAVDVEKTGGTLVVDNSDSPLVYEPCCVEHHPAETPSGKA